MFLFLYLYIVSEGGSSRLTLIFDIMIVGTIVTELFSVYGSNTANVFQKSLEASSTRFDAFKNIDSRIKCEIILGINNVMGEFSEISNLRECLSEYEYDLLEDYDYNINNA